MANKVDFVREAFLQEFKTFSSKDFISDERENTVRNFIFDENHLKLLLDCLTKFHTTSILYQRKQAHKVQEEKHSSEDPITTLTQSATKKSKEIIDLLDQFTEIKMKKTDFRRNFEESIQSISDKEVSVKMKVICCMNSPWRQVTFHYQNNKPVKCKITNLTSIFYSSPVYDVLFGIYSATFREFRKYNLNELLDYYYKSLENELRLNGIILKDFMDYLQYQKLVRELIPLVKLSSSLEKYQIIKENGLEKNKELLLDILKELEEYFTYKSCRVIPEDVHKIVKDTIGDIKFEIVHYSLDSIGKNSGFLGDHNKLNVTYRTEEGEKKLKHFAKLYPIGSPFANVIDDSDLFDKEILVYTEVINDMKKHKIDIIDDCVPRYIFGSSNDVLVVEDLSEAGFVMLDHKRNLSIMEMETVLKVLAKFHASGIILEEKFYEQFGSRKSLLDVYSRALKDGHFVSDEKNASRITFGVCANAIVFMIELIFGECNEDLTQYILNLYNKSAELLKPTQKFRNVMCHGDFWPPNFLVRNDDSGNSVDCRIIDFQIARYTLPAHDFMFIVIYATTHEHRKKYLKHYIDFYYNELRSAVKINNYDVNSLLPYEEFVEGCNHIIEEALFQVACWYQFGQISIEKFNNGEFDAAECLYRDKRAVCQSAYENDENFRTKAYESLSNILRVYEVYKKHGTNKNCQFLKEIYGI